ncbi:TAXI family TRAP transporter solute-binding subunit [Tranquillimonas rosea]|uniref:TAXI family TRAP transporter solute-binding subunit n=1 Tax=Tranquillimonas rosea TaxID=641238 RepID=UPI003BAB355C
MRVLAGTLGVLVALVAIWLLGRDLIPPKSLSFAAGTPGGGYAALAERYADILARDGIDVTILDSAGSVENAALLAEGRADVALLQGGILAPQGTEALGAVFHEPLFVFARADAPIPRNPGAWRDLRLAIGGQGSGTRAAVRSLLAASGVPEGANTLVPRGGADGAEALLSGAADAAFFVAPLTAPYLEPLFADTSVTLMRLDYLESLSRRVQHSEVVSLPAAAVSLAPPRPDAPTPLLAMVARLVADADLHPSLVDRLVMAAREIHSGRDQITDEQSFPTTAGVTMPLDVYARDLIRTGPSPLSSFLPYWMVAQVNRFAILLLPIVFLLLPLLRSIPGLYQWRMRAQVYHHYREILDIDAEARETEDAGRLEALQRRLDEIDGTIAQLRLPLAYRHYAYTARLHVDLVRARIGERLERQPA